MFLNVKGKHTCMTDSSNINPALTSITAVNDDNDSPSSTSAPAKKGKNGKLDVSDLMAMLDKKKEKEGSSRVIRFGGATLRSPEEDVSGTPHIISFWNECTIITKRRLWLGTCALLLLIALNNLFYFTPEGRAWLDTTPTLSFSAPIAEQPTAPAPENSERRELLNILEQR